MTVGRWLDSGRLPEPAVTARNNWRLWSKDAIGQMKEIFKAEKLLRDIAKDSEAHSTCRKFAASSLALLNIENTLSKNRVSRAKRFLSIDWQRLRKPTKADLMKMEQCMKRMSDKLPMVEVEGL